MMPKHNLSAYVECPFFRFYDGCKIACEGVQKNSNIHIAFSSTEERRLYMKSICYSNYKYCMVANALYNKYKDSED